ncbi:hypothetical protein BDN72DRAFT_861377 [Pluteus cervinus]|uniref:Uncharacterized protein n=1 Tax=Pluteus cervinus TaxID=181527 RepID=A0ACD3AFG7_9AGAR|nr:hypothetical protein BDN72DRAFT_861377 [Pluteus cervinus]
MAAFSRLNCSSHRRSSEDVIHYLMSFLGPEDLARWTQVDWHIHTLTKEFNKSVYDVRRVLKKHFSEEEIAVWHALLKITHAMISGSTALQLLSRVQYVDSDLDVYVQEDRSRPILSWLQHCYTQVSEAGWTPSPPQYRDRAITKVYTFVRTTSTRSRSVVQLILTKSNPLEAILNFGLTCVMNFITCDSAYSLFPKLTFDHPIAVMIGGRQDICSKLYAKYEKRGWEFKDQIIPAGQPAPSKRRYVGDVYCWIVPDVFQKVKVLRGLREGPLVKYINTFTLLHRPHPVFLFKPLRSPYFESCYTRARDRSTILFVKSVDQGASDKTMQAELEAWLLKK